MGYEFENCCEVLRRHSIGLNAWFIPVNICLSVFKCLSIIDVLFLLDPDILMNLAELAPKVYH